MNIIVRPASHTDTDIIADFNEAMAKETEGIKLERKRLCKGIEALIEDTSKGFYYLAEIDGKVVGQLMITYEWSDWRNATFWWIQSVYVHLKYRNQGVFRTLYTHIESIARKRRDVCGLRLYVDNTNKRARKTYEALGIKQSHYRMMEVDFVINYKK